MCEMHRIRAVSHHFVRMSLVCKIMAENGGIFPSHFEGSQNHTELGRIRGFDFRLAIEEMFDCYSFDKPCLFQQYVFVSIQTFEPRSKRFNIGCAKCIEYERFSDHIVLMTSVCKIRAETGGIFQSHLYGSYKHTELGRIRGFDFRLAIEVKFH
jgi:hypothetical protein